MICYRGMTFCPYYKGCSKAENCSRTYTPEVQQAADACGIPVMVFSAKPECYESEELA